MAKNNRDPKLDHEPLQWTDLSGKQRRAAEGVVNHFTSTLSSRMDAAATRVYAEADRTEKASSAKTKRSKANRLSEVASAATDKPVSLNRAAKNRVSAVEDAVLNRSKPGESMPGLGWYGDANTKVRAAAPGVEPHTAAAASSALSPGARPEQERASLAAQVEAHRQGKVDVGEHLVHHLASKGVSVPDALKGRKVAFGDLPGHVAGALALPENRKVAEKHSEGVDWRGINRVSNANNIAKSHEALSGRVPADQVQSPTGAPKTWSYTHNIAEFDEKSPQFHEYQARGLDLSSRIRGETHPGQDMLDLWGHRDSNEGILSNRRHTAEDSWQRAISINLSHEKMKAAGDLAPTSKTWTDPKSGEKISAHDDPRVKPEAVYHAWNNEATHRAAVHLQEKYQTPYTVPSVQVQEVGWTGTRRRVGADSDYNGHLREAAESAREPKAPKGQKQLGMF